uniref:Alba domain-containing protein n=1 Tax=Meloidogyne hapla TaxID=6305 RepID=A0A1I8B0Q2_MELHA
MAKGSIATVASSTTISDEENDDSEDFEDGKCIPDILLATTGHGKNSLIKTAAGRIAIAAAISKVIGSEQNKKIIITPIPEEKEEEGKE